jgi:hypothetical protein
MRTRIGRMRTFANDEQLTDTIHRGNGLQDLAARQALELGIHIGRGRTTIHLTPEQYIKLKGQTADHG